MQSTTKRALGVALGIIGVLTILAVALFYYLKNDLAKPPGKSVIKPILADQLKKMIVEASDSLYHLQFSYFDINTENGTGIIINVKLLPDSAVYQRLILHKKAPNCVLTMSVDSVKITHFAFEKTPDGRRLVMDDIIIQNPSFTINYKLQPYNDSDNIKAEKTVLNTMKNLMKFCSIRNIAMQNINFTLLNHNGNNVRTTSLKHLNITTSGVSVTTAKNNDSNHTEHTAISVEESRIATPDSLYHLITTGIRYIPETQSIFIKKTELKPRLDKAAFYKKANFRKDRYHFIQNDMQCNGIDINRLLRRQQIHIRSMSVGSSYSEIYTDYDYAKRTPPVRNHDDPHERLEKLAFDVTIDTMYLHNGVMEYAIKAEKSNDVAIMKMDKLENTITNITNNADAKKRNRFTTSRMFGRLMEGGNMRSTMRFNLTDPNGAFTLATSLGAMDGRLMNPFIKPLALMEIQSLNIQKMNTTITGNAYTGRGNIDFYYKDMKIALLKKKNDNTYKKKGLLSMVSNLVTPDDNPNKRGKFKKGPIHVNRNKTDSFFGFLWKCNLQGMTVHMMGLDKQ